MILRTLFGILQATTLLEQYGDSLEIFVKMHIKEFKHKWGLHLVSFLFERVSRHLLGRVIGVQRDICCLGWVLVCAQKIVSF